MASLPTPSPTVRGTQASAAVPSLPKVRLRLLEHARAFVLQHFTERADNRYTFHNYFRTTQLVELTQTLAAAERLDPAQTEVALLTAWFYFTGYPVKYDDPRTASIETVSEFLRAEQYDTDRVIRCLRNVDSHRTRYRDARVVSDAQNALLFGEDYAAHGPLLRLELELVTQQRFSHTEWAQFRTQRLLNATFQTEFAQRHFAPVLAQNLLDQRTDSERAQRRGDADDLPLRRFQHIERKVPTSAAQTFFRTNYRNHINLSAIADQKANIMITVNALLVSVVITVLTYQNITETRPAILMPAVIFLVTGLTSLTFAVLSARPKVTQLNQGERTRADIQRNVVFFGNFVTLDLEQYEQAMDAMLRDGELLYGNMTRDLYYLGKVLDRKYRMLSISYSVFLAGFVATVGTFLAVFLL